MTLVTGFTFFRAADRHLGGECGCRDRRFSVQRPAPPLVKRTEQGPELAGWQGLWAAAGVAPGAAAGIHQAAPTSARPLYSRLREPRQITWR